MKGEWYGISGPKTAVRDYAYTSPDFPEHFTRTRCVFTLDDGACSLQRYSEQHGNDRWKYKPTACWLHPLNFIDGKLAPPPTQSQEDPNNIGLRYPGFVHFTPCGQSRADGKDWRSAASEEMLKWQEFTQDSTKPE